MRRSVTRKIYKALEDSYRRIGYDLSDEIFSGDASLALIHLELFLDKADISLHQYLFLGLILEDLKDQYKTDYVGLAAWLPEYL